MNDDTISITRPSTIVGGPPIAKQPSMSQPVSTNTGTSNKLTNNFPTETIELPSQGHFYPDGHPLSDGHLELKMMTAREEDILTNQNLISYPFKIGDTKGYAILKSGHNMQALAKLPIAILVEEVVLIAKGGMLWNSIWPRQVKTSFLESKSLLNSYEDLFELLK